MSRVASRQKGHACALALWCFLSASSVQADEEPSSELVDWSEGPVRWYLLPSEKREIDRIDAPVGAVNFVERFWRLRDPDPLTERNEFREQFNQRVEAADLLYVESGLRGSLSPRGRALVVLGPPVHLRIGTEPALGWDAAKKGNKKTRERQVSVEEWRYPPESLPPRLRRVLDERGREEGIVLKFRVLRRATELVEGGSYLTLAARVVLIQG